MLEFKIPEIDDKQWVDVLLRISDYNGCSYTFGTIFSWQCGYKTLIARYGDALLMRSGNSDKFAFAYPAGKFDIKTVFDIIIKYCDSHGVPFKMYGVQENQRERIEKAMPGKFDFQEDRGFFDYIYTSEHLIELLGKKYHGKRNHISKFNRLYDWNYEKITQDNIGECRAAALQWFALENRNESGLEHELDAMNIAFDNYAALGYIGGLIRTNGEVAAFTMGERLNSNTFCTHFEKALPQYVGAYTVINNEFAKNELSSYEYINREEDMGIEGLRKAKLSYYPDILLKKYIVRVKNV